MEEIVMGGGHYTCEKCGVIHFGSTIHDCHFYKPEVVEGTYEELLKRVKGDDYMKKRDSKKEDSKKNKLINGHRYLLNCTVGDSIIEAFVLEVSEMAYKIRFSYPIPVIEWVKKEKFDLYDKYSILEDITELLDLSECNREENMKKIFDTFFLPRLEKMGITGK